MILGVEPVTELWSSSAEARDPQRSLRCWMDLGWTFSFYVGRRVRIRRWADGLAAIDEVTAFIDLRSGVDHPVSEEDRRTGVSARSPGFDPWDEATGQTLHDAIRSRFLPEYGDDRDWHVEVEIDDEAHPGRHTWRGRFEMLEGRYVEGTLVCALADGASVEIVPTLCLDPEEHALMLWAYGSQGGVRQGREPISTGLFTYGHVLRPVGGEGGVCTLTAHVYSIGVDLAGRAA